MIYPSLESPGDGGSNDIQLDLFYMIFIKFAKNGHFVANFFLPTVPDSENQMLPTCSQMFKLFINKKKFLVFASFWGQIPIFLKIFEISTFKPNLRNFQYFFLTPIDPSK